MNALAQIIETKEVSSKHDRLWCGLVSLDRAEWNGVFEYMQNTLIQTFLAS